MRYCKTLKKLKGKATRYLKAANREFDNRLFRNPDYDVFYLNIENALDALIKAIELWEDAVNYEEENPCM